MIRLYPYFLDFRDINKETCLLLMVFQIDFVIMEIIGAILW